MPVSKKSEHSRSLIDRLILFPNDYTMKKLRLILSLFAAATCLSSVAAAESAEESISKMNLYADSLMKEGSFVMRGFMELGRGHDLDFAVTDLLKNHLHHVTTDSTGHFCIEVPMRGPIQEVYLYRMGTVTFPVYPGDTVNVDLQKKTIALTGSTPEATRDLEFAVEMFRKHRPWYRKIYERLMAVPKESAQKYYVDSLMAPIVDEGVGKTKIWKEYQDSVENAGGPLRSSEYWRVKGYLEPLQVFIGTNFFNDIKAESGVCRPGDDKMVDFHNMPSEYLKYPDYRQFMSNMIAVTARRAGNMLMVSNYRDDIPFLVQREQLERAIAYDPLLANWNSVEGIDRKTKHHSNEDVDALLAYLRDVVKVKAFLPVLDELEVQNNRTKPGQPAPYISLVGEDGKKITLEDLRGKIVYFDFWSSSCGWCIREFKIMPEFMEYFKGKLDNVEFVTVFCGNDSDEKWKSLCDKYDLSHGLNVRLDTKGSDSLYDISSFPTYMLIDKDGKFIEINTFRPSVIMKLSKAGTSTTFEKAIGIK